MADTQAIERSDKQELETAPEGTRSGPYFEPQVDIFENDQALTIVADMPGVSEEDVEIDLREGVLTLLGNMEDVQPEGQVLMGEYRRGNYLRRFTLTDVIDQEKISASMKNGVLRVELPKVEKAQPRKIQVRAD